MPASFSQNPFDKPAFYALLQSGICASLVSALFNASLWLMASQSGLADFHIYSFEAGFLPDMGHPPQIALRVTLWAVVLQSMFSPLAGAAGFWLASRTFEHYRKAFWFLFAAVWLFSFAAPYAAPAEPAVKEVLALMHLAEGAFFIAFFRRF